MFLRWIQNNKMLLLSYQNQLSDNFSDFSPHGGTLMILDGSKLKVNTDIAKQGSKLKTKKLFRNQLGKPYTMPHVVEMVPTETVVF